MRQSGVYEIVNGANGKRYIGSAVLLSKRWNEHRTHLARQVHHSVVLQRAWNKYGPESFQFKPLLLCKPEHLLMFEQRAIDGYKPEYNICPTAGSSLGAKHSAEAKAKISAAGRGRVASPATRAALSAALTGRTFSPEHRAKISASKRGMVGHKHTPEFCAAVSARNIGNKFAVGNTSALGYKHTVEVRTAQSARQKGVPLSAAHRAAISAGNMGKVLSVATREKLSKVCTGIKRPAVAEANRRRAKATK